MVDPCSDSIRLAQSGAATINTAPQSSSAGVIFNFVSPGSAETAPSSRQDSNRRGKSILCNIAHIRFSLFVRRFREVSQTQISVAVLGDAIVCMNKTPLFAKTTKDGAP